uniref:Uncharacterized protein n=1 Tax=Pyricularia oryzae (strain P131) TaxID=1143193 RepID=L7ITH7_PYRO1
MVLEAHQPAARAKLGTSLLESDGLAHPFSPVRLWPQQPSRYYPILMPPHRASSMGPILVINVSEPLLLLGWCASIGQAPGKFAPTASSSSMPALSIQKDKAAAYIRQHADE